MYELTEFLVDVLGVEDTGASFPHRVTLHPTCHSVRALHIGDRPQRLLRAVRGIDLVELDEALECCGFGGTFAVKNADASMAMLGDKLRRVLDTRAEVCTAVDTSCLMHIGGALRAPARGRADDAHRRDPGGARNDGRLPRGGPQALADAQLRRNLGKATTAIRVKRAAAVGELRRLGGAARRRRGDQGARDGDAARSSSSGSRSASRAAGGTVHWARDGAEANAIVAGIAREHDATEVIKVKSLRRTRSASTRRSSCAASARSRPTSRS